MTLLEMPAFKRSSRRWICQGVPLKARVCRNLNLCSLVENAMLQKVSLTYACLDARESPVIQSRNPTTIGSSGIVIAEKQQVLQICTPTSGKIISKKSFSYPFASHLCMVGG